MGEKRNKIESRKAQVTIFVIIAIIIVLSIILYIILRLSARNPSVNSENINEYMVKCTQDAVSQALEIMLPQGGRINPENYVLYKDEKIEYLCYQSNYYLPCVNQYPLLIKSFEDEIKDYISPRINSCFDNVERNLRNKGYNIVMNGDAIKISFYPKQVRVDIEKSISLEKAEERRSYENFSSVTASPIYEMLNVAVEIVNGEAGDCNFDYSAYENNYPNINIDKIFTENSNQIWSLNEDKQEFKFAIRSCALPGAF